MRAMILAAGRGARMGDLTNDLPKPLIRIDAKTLIEHQIDRLRDAGILDIVINVAYRGAQIRAYLGNGEGRGVRIAYSQEPQDALDTGGGIAAALDLLGDDPLVVVNSDIWTDFNYSTLSAPLLDAHLILVPNPAHNPNGDFLLRDGRIAATGERWTFAGIGVYSPMLFTNQPTARFPLAPILTAAAGRRRVTAELYRGRWIDVGTPERLAIAKSYVAMQHKAETGI